MRKLFAVAAFLLAVAPAFAQNTQWYFSVSSGLGWGGPQSSLISKFEKTGFNQTSTGIIIFINYSIDYPQKSRGVPVTARAGYRLKENLNLFALAGASAAGTVEGYKKTGEIIDLGIFGGSVGTHITINYDVTEVAVGLEHEIKNTRLKLGYAPAAFILNYRNNHSINTGKETSLVPGVALTARMPLGKEKRSVGFELIADLNLAPPATIKEQVYQGDNGIGTKTVLSATKVNMVHGMAGVALTFRKKKNV